MGRRPRGRRDGPGSPGGKPGANSPCPCGSGKKYKRCCGRAVRPSERPDLPGRGAGGPSHDKGPDDDLSDITLEDLQAALPDGMFEKITNELGKMDKKEFAEFIESFDDMDEEEIEQIICQERLDATAPSSRFGKPHTEIGGASVCGAAREDEEDEDAGGGVDRGRFAAVVAALAGALGEGGELGEGEAYEVALADHPEYAKALKKGKLPDEIVGPDGNVMNPRLHLMFHTIMERQVADDEPRGVAAILKRLQVAGLTRHDAVHAMSVKVSDQIWYMLKEGSPFDEQRYMKGLEDLAAHHEKKGD